MSRYEFLLFAHVAAVIVWLGTGTAFALIAILGDRELLPRLGPLGAKLGPRVFAPASLGTLVFGILLVLDGHWSFDPLWIKLGFAAFAASFLLNVVVRAPLARRMGRGDLDPQRAGRLLALLARVELTCSSSRSPTWSRSRPARTRGRSPAVERFSGWWPSARLSRRCRRGKASLRRDAPDPR